MLGARRARRWPMLGQEEDSPPSGRAFALPARSSVRVRRRRLVWLWSLAAPAPRAQSCFARADSIALRCAPCRGFRFCCGGRPCALPLCRPPLDRTCTICPSARQRSAKREADPARAMFDERLPLLLQRCGENPAASCAARGQSCSCACPAPRPPVWPTCPRRAAPGSTQIGLVKPVGPTGRSAAKVLQSAPQ